MFNMCGVPTKKTKKTLVSRHSISLTV